ncbi:ABC transporter substrate-binding protein [Planctomycetota bacterium]
MKALSSRFALQCLGLAVLLASATPAFAQKDTPLEDPDGKPITTVEKYEYVPSETLPEVKGVSNYSWENDTVVFPVNVWIGWAPIIMANGGLEPSEESVFFKRYGFKVKLPVIDDPVEARDSFAAGKAHILWGTLDMMALFAPHLAKDSRSAIRIFQQVDWSNGGDGVVARGGIKSINDLKPKDGKKRVVALAQHSPSHYYMLNLMYYAGLRPDDVVFNFTGDAFQAASAFVNDDTVDVCVTWAPDIYNISDPKKSGIKDVALVSTTADAKRVIADVWAARADFAKDHPEVIEGLVRGIFDGMQMVKDEPEKAAVLFEKAFDLPKGEAAAMMADAHLTNYAENADFFVNSNNPSNFEQTWDNINNIYRLAGYIKEPVAFGEVMDPRVIEKVAPDYKDSKHEYRDAFAAVDVNVDEAKQILTRTVYIHFAPNRSDVSSKYDPNAEEVVKEIGRLTSQFGGSMVVISGHADRSRYDQVKGLGAKVMERHSAAVKALSERRARGVVTALKGKFPIFKEQAERFVVEGEGWEKPLKTHALSRRVEVTVLSPEQGE